VITKSYVIELFGKKGILTEETRNEINDYLQLKRITNERYEQKIKETKNKLTEIEKEQDERSYTIELIKKGTKRKKIIKEFFIKEQRIMALNRFISFLKRRILENKEIIVSVTAMMVVLKGNKRIDFSD
jgi:hypothetical protein